MKERGGRAEEDGEKEKTQINNFIDKRGNGSHGSYIHQKIGGEYYEKLCQWT